IGADEFADRFALVEGLSKHGRKVLRRGKILFLTQREDYLYRVYGRHGCDRRTRAACSQKIADAEIRVANDAGDGRGDRSKGEVQLSLFKCSPGSLNGCLRP